MDDSHIIPDPAKVRVTAPTHYHCYFFTTSGERWHELSKTDTKDYSSPDRPPTRTQEWLDKSRSLLQLATAKPEEAAQWILSEWAACCEKAMTPVPDWANAGRAERVLSEVHGCTWPSWSIYLRGGQYVQMAVVGTDRNCH